GSRRERGWLALFGGCCGLAFLTKGFLAFAVPVVIIVPYMIWAGRWKDLFPMAVIPVITAILVALPWAVAVHFKAPDYWHYFFWQEHVKRFMADNAQHKAPVWTYLAAFPVAALPWSALIPAAVKGMDRPLRRTSLFRYALCWFVFPLLFFSAASGKLLTYILPCFAPFAILMALGLSAGVAQPRRRALRVGIVILMSLFALVLAALVVIQSTGVGGFIPYTHVYKAVIAGVGVAMLIFCLYVGLKMDGVGSILSVAMGTMLLLATLQWVLPDDTIAHKAPGGLLLRNADRVTPATVLVSLEDPIRAVCWFYRRSDVFLLGRPGELAYGLAASPENRRRGLDESQFQTLIKRHAAGQVVLVGKAKHYRKWKKMLPSPIYTDSSGAGGYVFAQY
uniref:phospholipid carrier-dependent glycosyltransferase n=1 Tax=Desulfosarcina cetonica TaxID=90730 RepID=UPI000AFF688B